MHNFLERLWYQWLRRPYRLNVSIDEGKGKPVVLLHGLGAQGKDWQPLVTELTGKSYRVVALDLLGFGDSPKPPKITYSTGDHAKAVIASLKRLRLSDAIVIGHSMGCLIATHVAYQKPHLVSHLVLYQPPLFIDEPSYPAHAKRRNLYMKIYDQIAQNPEKLFSYTSYAGRIVSRISGVRLSQNEVTSFKRSLQNTILDQTAYDELKHSTTTTDIIYGRGDLVVTSKEIKDAFAHNPNITLHKVNSAHEITNNSATYIAKLIND